MKHGQKALVGNLTDSDLRLLRVFRSVAACGGFAAAELELNINSTISRHIRTWRHAWESPCAGAGAGGFASRMKAPRCWAAPSRMMAAMADFQHEVDELHQRLTGSMAVAIFDKTASNPRAATSAGPSPALMSRHRMFTRNHVQPINAIEAVGIMEGRFHLGIIPTHRHSSSLEITACSTNQMDLYCAAKPPLYSPGSDVIGSGAVRMLPLRGHRPSLPNMEITRELGLRASTRHGT